MIFYGGAIIKRGNWNNKKLNKENQIYMLTLARAALKAEESVKSIINNEKQV